MGKLFDELTADLAGAAPAQTPKPGSLWESLTADLQPAAPPQPVTPRQPEPLMSALPDTSNPRMAGQRQDSQQRMLNVLRGDVAFASDPKNIVLDALHRQRTGQQSNLAPRAIQELTDFAATQRQLSGGAPAGPMPATTGEGAGEHLESPGFVRAFLEAGIRPGGTFIDEASRLMEERIRRENPGLPDAEVNKQVVAEAYDPLWMLKNPGEAFGAAKAGAAAIFDPSKPTIIDAPATFAQKYGADKPVTSQPITNAVKAIGQTMVDLSGNPFAKGMSQEEQNVKLGLPADYQQPGFFRGFGQMLASDAPGDEGTKSISTPLGDITPTGAAKVGLAASFVPGVDLLPVGTKGTTAALKATTKATLKTAEAGDKALRAAAKVHPLRAPTVVNKVAGATVGAADAVENAVRAKARPTVDALGKTFVGLPYEAKMIAREAGVPEKAKDIERSLVTVPYRQNIALEPVANAIPTLKKVPPAEVDDFWRAIELKKSHPEVAKEAAARLSPESQAAMAEYERLAAVGGQEAADLSGQMLRENYAAHQMPKEVKSHITKRNVGVPEKTAPKRVGGYSKERKLSDQIWEEASGPENVALFDALDDVEKVEAKAKEYWNRKENRKILGKEAERLGAPKAKSTFRAVGPEAPDGTVPTYRPGDTTTGSGIPSTVKIREGADLKPKTKPYVSPDDAVTPGPIQRTAPQKVERDPMVVMGVTSKKDVRPTVRGKPVIVPAEKVDKAKAPGMGRGKLRVVPLSTYARKLSTFERKSNKTVKELLQKATGGTNYGKVIEEAGGTQTAGREFTPFGAKLVGIRRKAKAPQRDYVAELKAKIEKELAEKAETPPRAPRPQETFSVPDYLRKEAGLPPLKNPGKKFDEAYEASPAAQYAKELEKLLKAAEGKPLGPSIESIPGINNYVRNATDSELAANLRAKAGIPEPGIPDVPDTSLVTRLKKAAGIEVPRSTGNADRPNPFLFEPDPAKNAASRFTQGATENVWAETIKESFAPLAASADNMPAGYSKVQPGSLADRVIKKQRPDLEGEVALPKTAVEQLNKIDAAPTGLSKIWNTVWSPWKAAVTVLGGPGYHARNAAYNAQKLADEGVKMIPVEMHYNALKSGKAGTVGGIPYADIIEAAKREGTWGRTGASPGKVINDIKRQAGLEGDTVPTLRKGARGMQNMAADMDEAARMRAIILRLSENEKVGDKAARLRDAIQYGKERITFTGESSPALDSLSQAAPFVKWTVREAPRAAKMMATEGKLGAPVKVQRYAETTTDTQDQVPEKYQPKRSREQNAIPLGNVNEAGLPLYLAQPWSSTSPVTNTLDPIYRLARGEGASAAAKSAGVNWGSQLNPMLTWMAAQMTNEVPLTEMPLDQLKKASPVQEAVASQFPSIAEDIGVMKSKDGNYYTTGEAGMYAGAVPYGWVARLLQAPTEMERERALLSAIGLPINAIDPSYEGQKRRFALQEEQRRLEQAESKLGDIPIQLLRGL